MIQRACRRDVTISSSKQEDETGVYFLSSENEKFAVFKVGEKRTRMEQLARKLSVMFHFDENTLPALRASIAYPKLPKGDTVVELFNGNEKVFTTGDERDKYNEVLARDNFGVAEPYTLTGILEPYVPDSRKKIELSTLARVTAFSLLIGAKDIKADGVSSEGKMYDVEACMQYPLETEISPSKAIAAMHLPILENPLADQPIERGVIEEILHKIQSCNPLEAQEILRKEQVEIADLAAESLTATQEDIDVPPETVGESCGWDHGGCRVKVRASQPSADRRFTTIALDAADPQATRLLSEAQVADFGTRIERLRACLALALANQTPLTCVDMVKAVDLLYAGHYNALKRRSEGSIYTRLPLAHVVGAVSPSTSGCVLSPDDVARMSPRRETSTSSRDGTTPVSFGTAEELRALLGGPVGPRFAPRPNV
ncbi:MAG TPA: hypothetical protein VLF94_02625 [Chlamydiales bacterium]|nr:hypothetical protein [Chlamydiales bacterium]